VYWAYASAVAEDKEEQTTIKKEQEKMERMSKEFTDIDEGVISDSDVLDSLRKRVNSTKTDDDGSDPEASGNDPSGNPDGSPDGGSAPTATLDPPTASAEEIERLNKLFGMGDADK